MSKFGRGIDELEGNLFGGVLGGLGNEGLSEHEDSLFGSDTSTSDHDEVVFNDTVVGETTQRSDGLIGEIGSGGTGLAIITLGDSVYFLVNFSSVVVSELTSTGDCPGDTGGMPGTDATNLSETSVGFLLQMLDTESLHDTGNTLTLGDTDNVDHF